MRSRSVIRRDERGATLVIFAAFLIVAVILTAAVVDLGALRAEKKEVTLSTDAAALAAVEAIDYTDPNATGDGTDCSSVRSVDPAYPSVEDVADRYLTENGQSVLGECNIFFGTPGANEMYLTVTASDAVDYAFAAATGQEGGSTSGVSSARAGSASIDGVLPIGVCASDAGGVDTFVNPAYPFPQDFGGSESVTIDFENSNCDASGNHDQIDFVAGHPPGECDPAVDGAFCSDIRSYGYDGTVDPVVYGNPGGGGWGPPQLEAPLEDIEARKVHVFVPVIGDCSEVPPPDTDCEGASSTYPIKYLMEVVIDDFTATGAGSGITFDVYQVVDYAYYEANGLPTPTVKQQVITHICATTADPIPCTNNPAPTPPAPPPPPPPPPPCRALSISPASLTRSLETAPGPNKDKLTAAATFTLEVEARSACDDLQVVVSGGSGAGKDTPPSSESWSGDTYTINFAQYDKKFTPGANYSIEANDGGTPFDPVISTQLQITPP